MNITTQAVIFDMDGVISDTQIVHATVESGLLHEYGIDLTPAEITRRFAGVQNREMFPQLFTEYDKVLSSLKELVNEKWRRMEKYEGEIAEVPGTRECIESLKAQGIPLAVASASKLSYVHMVLNKLGLSETFNAICSAEEVAKGKPEPDVFLLAATRLNITPPDCIVIEDGISGMIAAHRGGMRCIGLVREGNPTDYPADIIVKDLRDVIITKQ